jgi:hypothetical protein
MLPSPELAKTHHLVLLHRRPATMFDILLTTIPAADRHLLPNTKVMGMGKPDNGNLHLLLSKLCSVVGQFQVLTRDNVPYSLPKRDWRDWFIMATVMGGVGYGVYFVAKVWSCNSQICHCPPVFVKLDIDGRRSGIFFL